KTAESKTAAVITATSDGKLNRILSDALAKRVQSNDIQIATDYLQPEFVSDGLFKSIFDGSRDALQRLEMTNSLDMLVLARQTVQYSRSPALDNLITARMGLEV